MRTGWASATMMPDTRLASTERAAKPTIRAVMPAEASRPRATGCDLGQLGERVHDAHEDDGRHDQPPRHAHAGLVGGRQLAREQRGDAAAVSFHEAVDEPCHHEGGHEQEQTQLMRSPVVAPAATGIMGALRASRRAGRGRPGEGSAGDEPRGLGRAGALRQVVAHVVEQPARAVVEQRHDGVGAVHRVDVAGDLPDEAVGRRDGGRHRAAAESCA